MSVTVLTIIAITWRPGFTMSKVVLIENKRTTLVNLLVVLKLIRTLFSKLDIPEHT